MASGSTGRANSGSMGFDFASDDILCTYDDFANQDSSNGTHSDVIGTNSGKDFQKTRMARSSAYSESSYNRPEDSVGLDMITIVERTMKKHNENIMRFLEGISSRLSQLELHCYNLDKSIGEMRSDLGQDHGEADSKLKTLEKHIQEVHRSVQILRDKQELADAQKELAKLHLVHKESSSSGHSQSEEKAAPPAPDSKKPENTPEIHNNHLAIEFFFMIFRPPISTPVPQQQSYYVPQAQAQAQAQAHHGQYMTPDPQYQTPQAPQPVQTQISQTPQGPQFPPYLQQWPPQQPTMQPHMRSSSPSVYPTYPPPGQPANSSPQEPPQPNSMPLQVSYAAVPQVPYGYGPKGNYGAPQQLGDGYPPAGPHSALPPGSTYMVYDNSEGGRPSHHPPPQQAHYPPGIYPPAGSTNMLPRNPTPSHYVRNHPYGELVDKLVSMGFRGDHVLSVIQRMDESGQPVDFNAVLDRLSTCSGVSQRGGWSG